MAKFCTRCGKPLEDGKPCDCKQEETVSNQSKKVNVDTTTNTNANNLVNDYFDIVKGMFKTPAKTIKKYAKEENFNLALISIALTAVLFGVMVHCMLNAILKAIGMSMNSINTLLEATKTALSTYGMNFSIDTNFGLKAGIAMGVISFVIVGIEYLMHSIVYKKAIDAKRIISMVGISQVFYCIGLLITIVISFINSYLAMISLLFFSLCFFVHLHQGIIEISDLDQNQLVYTITATLLIPVIAIVAVLAIMLLLNIVMTGIGAYSVGSVNNFSLNSITTIMGSI